MDRMKLVSFAILEIEMEFWFGCKPTRILVELFMAENGLAESFRGNSVRWEGW